jgi:hypothetical protein
LTFKLWQFASLYFGSGWTEFCWAFSCYLVLLNLYWASVPGWTNNNALPAQSHARCLQAYNHPTMTNNITSVETLQNLVDLDKEDHKLKDIAKLFLNAMTDWTTLNQTNIPEFILELKQYFGTPLTITKIKNKPLNLSEKHASWRHEAGSSIQELISISESYYNESDFDQIIKTVLNYYCDRKF